MSLPYAEEQIKRALTQSRGNTARAKKLILDWAKQDAKLLQGLTQHHLNGIVAYHIERVASGRHTQTRVDMRPARTQSSTQQATGGEFGMDLLKAVANSSASVFGLEGYSAPLKRGQASQRHINAIQQLVTRTIPKK